MLILRLLFREVQYRTLNFLLGLIAVVAAVGLFVSVLTLCDASNRETTRLMRDLGFNVLIVPQGTDMADFWSQDFAKEEMPEEYVHRLAQTRELSIRHLIARLQKKIDWRGRKILLTGILPEVPTLHKDDKAPMGLTIPRGQVYVGFELARSMNLKEGEALELGGRRFVVNKCLGEKGSKDDIRIYGHLHDVQAVLGKPGRINEIEALSCQCEGERLPRIRQEIARALPDTQVTEFRSIAVARAEQREMVEKYTAFLSPAVLLVGALWVGLLAWSNVRERRGEIGLWRALGVGSGPIAALFIGKAVVLGLVGAGLGFALGTWLALHVGPQVFPLTAPKIAPLFPLLGWSLVAAPLVCAVASYLPALAAVAQDPAEVLREE
jgi:ABC-type lipoprotein release transport system permease subunit